MGLYTETELGIRYDMWDWKVRTWHTDRHDCAVECEVDFERDFRREHRRSANQQERKEYLLSEGFIKEECEIGRNEHDSNPNFRINIFENREWDQDGWVPDGRFVIDFDWPCDSDADWQDFEGKNPVKICPCKPEELKKLADFIYDFLETQPKSWGAKVTNQTKNGCNYNFNIKYLFNYYINDETKYTEKVDFNFEIKKYHFGNTKFDHFVIKVPYCTYSKDIEQAVDTIMTPLQLKEFADFIYSVL